MGGFGIPPKKTTTKSTSIVDPSNVLNDPPINLHPLNKLTIGLQNYHRPNEERRIDGKLMALHLDL
ncbi:hypothetical protein V6Z12_D11G118800 [Gossypium hirsutum]